MRKLLFVALIVASVLPRAAAQNPAAGGNSSSRDASLEVGAPILRITTREVLLDLIALDLHNKPVLDLKPGELQVSAAVENREPDKKRKKHSHDPVALASIEPITHLSIFDPNNPTAPATDSPTGFRILASCLERTTAHYLLAFHPGSEGWTSGFHRIAITTTRPGTKLFYRHQYYVGLASPAPATGKLKPGKIEQILQQSACYYPVEPLSISLRGRLIDTGRTHVVRYLVSVDASSLSFLTMNSDSGARDIAGFDRRIELDYGTCNFDANGKPVSYFHAPLDKVLNSADYARALDRGFPHILEFPSSGHIALTRIVLRDRATGNLGAADVTVMQADHAQLAPEAPAIEQTENDLKTYEDLLISEPERDGRRQPRPWIRPSPGPIGSFGSIVPASRSFCGDVYELPGTSDQLPDFRELDPIGSVYTSSLDVPNQFFSNTSGIPGVTPRTNLFGIDYHGAFWVGAPGEYRFRLASDDGAILQIDDKEIINLDGMHSVDSASARVQLDSGLHSIHVPYYQGAVTSVALELWVKPPGATKWAIFDLNDYQSPGFGAVVSR
jgi:hypothetical protein